MDPSVPPPTPDEIASLSRYFYDNHSSAAGTYVLVDVMTVQIQSQNETQLTACLAFDFASVSSPDTIAGTDTRLFTLAPGSDGTWQVRDMYYSGSCSLS